MVTLSRVVAVTLPHQMETFSSFPNPGGTLSRVHGMYITCQLISNVTIKTLKSSLASVSI
jgi:hypothetical protein